MADDRAYRILITFDAKNERFEGRAPELGVFAKGDTRAAAIENVEAEIEAKVAALASNGEELPEAVDGTEPEPGEVTLSIAAPLMAELRYAAERSNLSVDAFASQLFAHAVGAMSGARVPRVKRSAEPTNEDDQSPGNRRRNNQRKGGRRREGYQPDMDDQANFLAYVRNMEKGGRGR